MDLEVLRKGGLGLVTGVIVGLLIVWWLDIPAEAAATKMILVLAVVACTALGGIAGAIFSAKKDRSATGGESR